MAAQDLVLPLGPSDSVRIAGGAVTRRFVPELLNDPFGDPGAYVDFTFSRRAMLFDLGDLSALPARKLLRVSDVFVSHMHIDHFVGFDRLLRYLIGREKTVRLCGPPGFTDAVRHKLAAYTWNLAARYEARLHFVVNELVTPERMRTTRFRLQSAFQPEEKGEIAVEDSVVLAEPDLRVRAALLDHGTPCLAFALEESERINIWRNEVEDLGLSVGPWLTELKDAMRRGAPDDTPIRVHWKANGEISEKVLPLGELARKVTRRQPGEKIAYVVDVRHTPENALRVVELVKGADTLFIEAAFLDEAASLAAERNHLTAGQAGSIARQAGAKRIVPFHFSTRHGDEADRLHEQALAAFNGQ